LKESEHGLRPTELQAIVRLRFHDGDVEEFKRLSAPCMEIVRTQDTGTLQHDTYFNDDETDRIVIERFRDSEAAAKAEELDWFRRMARTEQPQLCLPVLGGE
jgi:quinol monooxygenase YgiN